MGLKRKRGRRGRVEEGEGEEEVELHADDEGRREETQLSGKVEEGLGSGGRVWRGLRPLGPRGVPKMTLQGIPV